MTTLIVLVLFALAVVWIRWLLIRALYAHGMTDWEDDTDMKKIEAEFRKEKPHG